MQTKLLRVLQAENAITEMGIALRSLCAQRGRGLELVYVSKAENLPKALLQSQPHVAFLALSMLQPDPLLLVSLLHNSATHIPLILSAPPADKDCAAGCLSADAENYMLEGYMDVPTLDRVVHSAIQRRAAVLSSASSKSRLDSLTRPPNRSGLLHQVQRSLQNSLLSGSRLIVSVRLENLKHLYTIAGHPTVERALRQTAQLLQSSIRRSDLIAHVSRALFVLVLSDAGDSCLLSLQRRLTSRLMQLNQAQGAEMALKFSIQTYS